MRNFKHYLYIAARSVLEADVITAECRALIGTPPDENGILLSENCVDVTRSAYIKTCMEILFQTTSIEQLYQYLDTANLSADDFRVSVTKIPSRLPLDSMTLMREIGARIKGKPNLNNPRKVFLLVATTEQLWFGIVTSETDKAWVAHVSKPYNTSSSLPARLCRAVVNMVANVGERLVDPCCGAGTILIEAAQMGINVVGYDINPKMVGASKKNLAHLSLEGEIHLGDARVIKGSFDAFATDLPYGVNSPESETLYVDILRNIKSLATVGALITARDITDILSECGYHTVQVIPSPKVTLTRYIHIVETKRGKG